MMTSRIFTIFTILKIQAPEQQLDRTKMNKPVIAEIKFKTFVTSNSPIRKKLVTNRFQLKWKFLTHVS